jgi:hypothetical protein
MKRLEFDERSRPRDRKDVKLSLMAKQQGKCAICGEPLPAKGSELDQDDPVLGYTEANCKLVHHGVTALLKLQRTSCERFAVRSGYGALLRFYMF